jgi:hypothetical protein
MFWMFLLLLVMALVFFKLGVLTVWLGVFELLGKLLLFGTGLFGLVYAGRWMLRRRRPLTLRWGR